MKRSTVFLIVVMLVTALLLIALTSFSGRIPQEIEAPPHRGGPPQPTGPLPSASLGQQNSEPKPEITENEMAAKPQ